MLSYKFSFVLVLLAVVLVAQGSERKCVDGKNYHDGCNSCGCANGMVICTMKMCLHKDEATGQLTEYTPVEPPEDFWEPSS